MVARWRSPGVTRPLREHVFYELHVGTFTKWGTYLAAAERLPELARLGVTTIELMPLSAFAGRRGWGYDGVAHFAPFAPYGRPDDLRELVDTAHDLGLSVLLDVVYNHFGPSGNYLSQYSPDYFASSAATPWGAGPNFGHPVMRRYVLDNARYWLDEFCFDGLRLDAVQTIVDHSEVHILRELASEVAELRPKKLLVAETDQNDPRLVTALGCDAIWADDFHHQVRVTLTRERDGYYGMFSPGLAGIAQVVEHGWLRGGSVATELEAERLVYFIQNHDQIGNRAFGNRLCADVSLDAYAAVSTLLLLLPMTPLVFMGQEWAASSPFLYFTDHEPGLGELVSRGRREEFKDFEAFRDRSARESIPDPQAPETFAASRLRWEERDEPAHRRILEIYRELLLLRRTDRVFAAAGRESLNVQVIDSVLSIRIEVGTDTRLVLVNVGDVAVALPDLDVSDALWEELFATRSSPGELAAASALVLAKRS
jgi:maltooligosyltrehalose trehalohydrolase